MTHWTVAHKAPLSMGFPSKSNWSGLRFPSPRPLPRPETEPKSPTLAGGFFTTESPRKPSFSLASCYKENLRSAMHALPVTLPSRNVINTHSLPYCVFLPQQRMDCPFCPRPGPSLLCSHTGYTPSLPQPTAFFHLLNVLQVLLLDLPCPHLSP